MSERIAPMDMSRFKPAALPKQLGQALAEADWNSRNVLVGCLRDRQQLRVCLRHGFYHMPANRLEGDAESVRWVAIYQSQSLFGSRCGVRYYGRVTGCQLVPRREITQIPRDSDTPYYRFAVSGWKRLPKKILSKELPFTHLRTTEFLLRHSKETPELFLEDGQQFQLYYALRSLLTGRRKNGGFRLGDSAVVLKRGEICTLRDGVLRPSFVQENFRQLPYTVFSHILLELSAPEE